MLGVVSGGGLLIIVEFGSVGFVAKITTEAKIQSSEKKSSHIGVGKIKRG